MDKSSQLHALFYKHPLILIWKKTAKDGSLNHWEPEGSFELVGYGNLGLA